MESLTSLKTNIISRNYHINNLNYSNTSSRSTNHISYHTKTSYSLALFHPISSSKLAHSSSQEGSNIETMATRKSVTVKFKLEKQCQFGDHFLMVGDDPVLGSWEPSNAAPFNWSQGHIWSLTVELPVNKPIRYKFLLKKNRGEILWQPGPDRVFQTWDTDNVIVVCEDWENAKGQKISEESHITDENKRMGLVMCSHNDHCNVEVSGEDENVNVEDCSEVGNRYLPFGKSVTNKSKSLRKLPTQGDYEGKLVLDDEGPVLVPGLTVPYVP